MNCENTRKNTRQDRKQGVQRPTSSLYIRKNQWGIQGPTPIQENSVDEQGHHLSGNFHEEKTK